ncbi:MAG TPA: universal stress protein [Acidimicrobiales bacterium]|nr:universal stress protein [Acidimicrobiales bacterium]
MRAPKLIAVGYDGSPDAEAALRWAASLAVALGAEVRAVHAVGLLEHAGMAQVAAHEQRAREVATARGLDAIRFEWCVEDGDPDTVLQRAGTGPRPADLIVVGTRGAGAHPGVLLGSTSLGLAERPPVPVVVVPTRSEPEAGSPADGASALTRRRAPGGSPPE